ncbi:hypothetical protein H4Q26_003946 [Puccinia striiformis f. sp. tritici PST-130]|nr:hypothetical protein H4Q26_003946 [Puccinia striiformis f. sp. tritici PST-130]
MYLDEKIDLLHENNNTLSQFQTLSAATQKSLDNSLATANSMSIFSDILRTSLSATEENKKALDKTSAKLNNDFAKAFDKLHLNKDALRDILDKNRVMSASIDELQRSSERIIVSKDEEQDKYESLTSDIDSTHQLLQNVAVAVNDVSSSLANFQSESSATARESLVHSQNVQTQVSNLSESFHNDLNQLQNRLDSIHRELRSTYNSSNVTLAHHTTPSPHTSTTPNLAVPSSTYENSRSQPENNNANRTTASDLSKDAPKVKDWPKFTGEGEYNHVEFIKTIDMFQEDFELRDIDITGKFCLIFQHSAKKWYLMIRKIHGKQPWAWWKEQINTKWGNAAWVYRMEEAFDKAHFEPGTSKPLVWFSKQKDRLSAIFPDMSESGLHERILKKCGGDLEHAVKCRTNRSSSTEDIINALEDIVERTKIGRRYNKSYTPSDNKTDPKKTTVNRLDNKPFVRKCHKCDSPDHLANVCTKPRKTINAIEQGTSNSSDEKDTPAEEDEEESTPDESEQEDYNDLDISAIEVNYNVSVLKIKQNSKKSSSLEVT